MEGTQGFDWREAFVGLAGKVIDAKRPGLTAPDTAYQLDDQGRVQSQRGQPAGGGLVLSPLVLVGVGVLAVVLLLSQKE